MSFKEFIGQNYIMFFELIGLLITLFISVYISKRIKMLARIAIALIFVTIVASAFEKWTQTFDTLSIWRPILTACKYSLYPTIIYFFILIVSSVKKNTSKIFNIVLLIPILIFIPIYFTSQWTHLICYYSEKNGYHGGPFNRLPYFLFGLYLVVFIVQNILLLKNYSIRSRAIVVYIPLGAALGVLIFLLLDITDDYLPIFTSSIVFYFLFLYIHMAGVDTLTGLVNRQNYYHDIDTVGPKVSSVVSIDMNDLKMINDNEGHDAGDKAIVDIANILRDNAGSRSTIYRIGGDEFIIFYYDVKEDDVTSRIEAIKEGLVKDNYSCAIGYAMVKNVGNLEEAIKAADRRMYLDKALIKQGRKTHETIQ